MTNIDTGDFLKPQKPPMLLSNMPASSIPLAKVRKPEDRIGDLMNEIEAVKTRFNEILSGKKLITSKLREELKTLFDRAEDLHLAAMNEIANLTEE